MSPDQIMRYAAGALDLDADAAAAHQAAAAYLLVAEVARLREELAPRLDELIQALREGAGRA